jgi:DNA-directed RNA polymerase subunit L
MELRVIEKTEDELSIEISGEDHTFMNVLKGTLLESENVGAATYDMNPEQSGGQTEPILTIKTEGDAEPLAELEAAAGRIQEKTDAITNAFQNATA